VSSGRDRGRETPARGEPHCGRGGPPACSPRATHARTSFASRDSAQTCSGAGALPSPAGEDRPSPRPGRSPDLPGTTRPDPRYRPPPRAGSSGGHRTPPRGPPDLAVSSSAAGRRRAALLRSTTVSVAERASRGAALAALPSRRRRPISPYRWRAARRRAAASAERMLAPQVESCSPRLLRLTRRGRVGRLRAFGRGPGRGASQDILARLERRRG
jgi:hypothetical protein